jgi:hypothetical protein
VRALGFHETRLWHLSRDGAFRRGVCSGRCLRTLEFPEEVFDCRYNQLRRDRYQYTNLRMKTQTTYTMVIRTRTGVTGDNGDGTAECILKLEM